MDLQRRTRSLGRVNNTSTADSENEIYVFFLTELDTFTYFGKTRVRDNAAQGNEINAGISKTSGNFVDQRATALLPP